MASDKKRRKASKAKQPGPKPAGPFRHPDGDRRHRGGADAKQAIRNKKIVREFPGVRLPDDPPAGG